MKPHNITYLILAIIAFFMSMFIRWLAQPKLEYKVFDDTSKDYMFVETIDSFDSINTKYTITKNENEADIILTSDSSKFSKKSGFSVLEDAIYSPMVILIDDKLLEDYDKYKDYFSKDVNTSNKNVYYVNANNLLKDALNDKTYKDVGLGNSQVEKINFIIPDETNSYYDEVVEFVYLTFNNGKELTQEDIDRLKPDVDKFLSKCKKVTDISTYANKDVLKKSFIIVPEFMFRTFTDNDDIGFGNIKNTNIIDIDIVIKDEIKETFINKKLSKDSFIDNFSFRNIYFNDTFYTLHNSGSYIGIANFVNPVKIDDSLKFEY